MLRMPSDPRPRQPSNVPTAKTGSPCAALIDLALLIPFAVLVFAFQAAHADWKNHMESVGGVIIQDMATGHGWVSPLINDQHIPTKPPLYYWVGAAIARVRGSGGDVFDARAASALLGALGIAVV